MVKSRLSTKTKKAVMKAKQSGRLTGAEAKALRADLRSQAANKKGSTYKYKKKGATTLTKKKTPASEKKLIRKSGISNRQITAQKRRTALQTGR